MSSITNSCVFVVANEDESCHSIRDLVTPMGISCTVFRSAEAFLHGYDASQRGCLVVDLRLPEMSGVGLLEQLRDRHIYLPTIVWTAYADVRSTVEVMQSGALNLLEKTCDEYELWEAVRHALVVDLKVSERMARRAQVKSRLASLTEVEKQTLEMIVAGLPNKAIASRSGVSLRTIEGRRKNVFRKTGTHCVAELVTAVREVEQPPCYCQALDDVRVTEPTAEDPRLSRARWVPSSIPKRAGRTA